MGFFIKQNSNLPILKMDIVRGGITDLWKNFYFRVTPKHYETSVYESIYNYLILNIKH